MKITLWLAAFAACFLLSGPSQAADKAAAVADPLGAAVGKLKNSDPNVRRKGCEELGSLRNPAAVASLLPLMEDKVAYVRSAAIDALGLLRTASAAPAIAKKLTDDPDPQVRQTAAIALGYLGDKSTIPSLTKALKDIHEGTRFAAINTLGILRDASATRALTANLQHTDPRMRNASAYALSLIADKSSVPDLIDALQVAISTQDMTLYSPEVSASIARTLGILSDPASKPVLAAALKAKDVKTRLVSAEALAKMGDAAGLKVARAAALAPEKDAREISARVLGEFGDVEDVKLLQKMRAQENDANTKNFMDLALQKAVKRLKIDQQKILQEPNTAPAKKSRSPKQ